MKTNEAGRNDTPKPKRKSGAAAWFLALGLAGVLVVGVPAAAQENVPGAARESVPGATTRQAAPFDLAPGGAFAGPDSVAAHDRQAEREARRPPEPGSTPARSKIAELWRSTGLAAFLDRSARPSEAPRPGGGLGLPAGLGQLVMIALSCFIIYLAIHKQFEPLLLLPIGFGGILSNIPQAGIAGPDGLLGILSAIGLETGLFPLLIFMGVGALTDFAPLIAHPKTALLGAAAQFGIFTTLIGALVISDLTGRINFSLRDAAAIGIIGGADGPTAIFLAGRLAPDLLGAIAVAAYSYMALVPIIQPPIMKLLTTKSERALEMKQLREVKRIEKILFPLAVLGLCILLLPAATPLVGMLMFGNLLRESGVVERLHRTAANELINIVTILLGLSVGSKLAAERFLHPETLGILLLGLFAFSIGTAAGVLLAKLMNALSREKINPLIGAAGVSAVPMASRVATRVGLEANANNYLLMHAMGPNVAGVIGSAVAAGVLLALCG